MEHTEKLTQENNVIGLESIHAVLVSIYEELKAIREQKVNITLSGNCSASKEELLNSIPFKSSAISPQAERPPLRYASIYDLD